MGLVRWIRGVLLFSAIESPASPSPAISQALANMDDHVRNLETRQREDGRSRPTAEWKGNIDLTWLGLGSGFGAPPTYDHLDMELKRSVADILADIQGRMHSKINELKKNNSDVFQRVYLDSLSRAVERAVMLRSALGFPEPQAVNADASEARFARVCCGSPAKWLAKSQGKTEELRAQAGTG